jgi:hypothetical protein
LFNQKPDLWQRTVEMGKADMGNSALGSLLFYEEAFRCFHFKKTDAKIGILRGINFLI